MLAVGDIGDELVAKIRDRAMSLRTGDGTRGPCGPLVTSQAKEQVSGYIDAGEAAERHLSWTGGSRRWMPMVTASSSGRRCSIM